MSAQRSWVSAAIAACCWLALASVAAGEGGAISVAIYDHSGRPDSKGPTNLERLLTEEAGFTTKRVSAAAIRDGALSGVDVVIFPGGSGSAQAKRLEAAGRDAVREYVRDGGGYVGICAGSYLASAQYDWSLDLLRARVIDRKHWARGTGVVRMSLSEEAHEVLGAESDEAEVYYGQGPLLAPAIEPGLPPYTALALYETEIAKKGAPEGVMMGTTAIASADYGAGRVLCFSPHPEKSDGPHEFIVSGVRWAAGWSAAAE